MSREMVRWESLVKKFVLLFGPPNNMGYDRKKWVLPGGTILKLVYHDTFYTFVLEKIGRDCVVLNMKPKRVTYDKQKRVLTVKGHGFELRIRKGYLDLWLGKNLRVEMRWPK